MTRIESLRSTLDEVYPMSMGEWLDGFQRDAHPEQEVIWWERLARCYVDYSSRKELNAQQRRDAFKVICGLALGSLGTNGMEPETSHLFATLQNLVEGWCDRRCLRALRAILRGYPLTSPLTDGWGELLTALQDVRGFAGSELTDAERTTVDDCIRLVQTGLRRR